MDTIDEATEGGATIRGAQVQLGPHESTYIRQLAERTGCSMNELLRTMVSRFRLTQETIDQNGAEYRELPGTNYPLRRLEHVGYVYDMLRETCPSSGSSARSRREE